MRGARGLSPRGARVFLAVLSDPRPKGSGSISCAVREKRGARVILFTATFGTCGAVQIFDLGNSSHTEERRELSPEMEYPGLSLNIKKTFPRRGRRVSSVFVYPRISISRLSTTKAAAAILVPSASLASKLLALDLLK